MLKKHWFYCKTSPSHRQPPASHGLRIPGLKFTHSFWKYYNESLQTSCLVKKAFVLLCVALTHVEKALVLQRVCSNILKKQWFYYVFARTCRKSACFTRYSLANVEIPLVLLCFRSTMLNKHLFFLCFRSKMLKKHWFYCVFAHKAWKSTGFTVCSLENIEKALVLICFRSKIVKSISFFCKTSPQHAAATDSDAAIHTLVLGERMRNPYRQAV